MAPGHEDVVADAHGDDDAPGTVAAVRRWLALGRDVVVRGDRASGRTRVLQQVHADSSRRSTTSLLLRASGNAPGAALRAHASAVAERPSADPLDLLAWLVAELQGRRPLLLLDDIDLFDTESAQIVLQALRLTSAAFVASTTDDLTYRAEPAVAELVAARAPAEVRIAPLGFRGVSRLLADTLRAPADVALTSAVIARSAGNPGVAVALADGARFAGVARLVQGRWRKHGSLDAAPVDAVAHALLPRLSADQIEALELLAWTGPVPRALAEVLVDPAVLASLARTGRVHGHAPAERDDAVAVAPPALAAALRARLGPDRRRALTARIVQQVGPRAAPFDTELPGPADLVLDAPRGAYWWWTADLTGLLHERTSAQESARRTDWQTDPSVAHAVAYLAVLLRRRATGQVAAVLAGTERRGDEAPDELVDLLLDEIRWAAWRGESRAEIHQRLDRWAGDGDPVRDLIAARRQAQQELRDGHVRDHDDARPVAGSSRARRWRAVARASALLNGGRPDLALDVCAVAERSRDDDAPSTGRRTPEGDPAALADADVDHHLEGVHGEALLMLGRLDEAARRARRLLERSIEDLDVVGVRIHSCVLAEALALQGEPGAAWRVVSTSLRLGPGGPLDNTFYRRTLTLGATLLAQRGTRDVAAVLLDELERTPSGYRPAIHALGALGRAALAVSAGETGAADVLWEAGRGYAEQGLPLPALTCWLASPEPYDAERLALVRRTAADCHAPLLEPYLRLHEALAAADQDGIVAALASARRDVAGLLRTALAALDAQHAADPALGGLRPAAAAGDEPRREALTVREREVAAMAGSGMTNRQIADRLNLSVRTVENHVSSVLHKLGMGRRSELTRWFGAPRGTEPGDQVAPDGA